MEIMRNTRRQFVLRHPFDAAGFDHYHVVGVLHRAFDFQKRLLGDDQAQALE